ncbi:MAG: dihydrofolate reductase [Saprospiraceae bacterium]
MIVSAIAAVSKNGVIGKNNEVPWYLPADLKYFKNKTLDRHVIMGRKTLESIVNPLPKRTNIILTRDPFFVATNVIVAHTMDEALDIAEQNGEEEAFVLGGAEIYQLSLPYLDKLYITEVAVEVPDGDTFFPEVDWKEWKLISQDPHQPDDKNEFAYNFKVYQRVE